MTPTMCKCGYGALCEEDGCTKPALGFMRVRSRQWLVCSHHARRLDISEQEIAEVEEMWKRSAAANDCDQHHRTRSA